MFPELECFWCGANSSLHFDLEHRVKLCSHPALRVTPVSNEWVQRNSGTKPEKCIVCLQALFLYQLMVMGMDQLHFLVNSLDNPGASRCFSAQTCTQTALILKFVSIVAIPAVWASVRHWRHTTHKNTNCSNEIKWKIRVTKCDKTSLKFVISHVFKKKQLQNDQFSLEVHLSLFQQFR